VLPSPYQSVLRIPPGSRLGDPALYTFVIEVAEADGTYFLATGRSSVPSMDLGAYAMAQVGDGGYKACELNPHTCHMQYQS